MKKVFDALNALENNRGEILFNAAHGDAIKLILAEVDRASESYARALKFLCKKQADDFGFDLGDEPEDHIVEDRYKKLFDDSGYELEDGDDPVALYHSALDLAHKMERILVDSFFSQLSHDEILSLHSVIDKSNSAIALKAWGSVTALEITAADIREHCFTEQERTAYANAHF